MEGKNELNVGYILSLQTVDGKLVVKEIPIEYTDAIVSVLDKLNEYSSNDQVYNAFDVERFIKRCDFKKDGIFGYCWPHEYNASFISSARILEINKEEYKRKLDEIKDSISEEYEKKKRTRRWVNNHYEYLSEHEKDLLEKEKQQKIDEKQAKYEQARLHNYIDEVRRYIFALYYDNTLQKVKTTSLMYSSETIGWYKPYFNITGNARIGLRSNFCYGRSAYFDVLLNYKGINILPYSDLVTYYWSNIMDNIRCTRSYSTYRTNWNEVLKFVADICNWIERDSDSFEKQWIVGEVESMMTGLKDVKNNITAYYNKLKDATEENKRNRESSPKPQPVRYRWIDDRITDQFKTYPYETTLIIQVDKLSAALSLLDELSSLKTIYSPVTTHIYTILQYNKEVLPVIKKECSKLSVQIKTHQKELKQLERKIEFKKKRLSIRQNEISAKLDITDESFRNSSPNERQTKLTNECVNDTEYKALENEIADLHEKLNSTQLEIFEKESFKSHLETRRDYIEESIKHWDMTEKPAK